MTHFWRVLVLTCCSNTQLCSYNTLELTTRQKCVIYEDKPKTRQERVLHNTSKQHTKSVLFVQHARKQHAKNITRQYRVEHTFAVSTTRTKVRVVSTRLQHVKISSVQALLQNMKSSEPNNNITAGTRGGLVTPCNGLVEIFKVAEISFREHVDNSSLTLRNIPAEIICNSTLSSPTVKSLWDNIVVSSEPQPSNSTQKLCLENVVKLYLKVRAFSYARDYITKYRIKAKQVKKKALRKDMKKSDTSNSWWICVIIIISNVTCFMP